MLSSHKSDCLSSTLHHWSSAKAAPGRPGNHIFTAMDPPFGAKRPFWAFEILWRSGGILVRGQSELDKIRSTERLSKNCIVEGD